jgi:hypothetical protein
VLLVKVYEDIAIPFLVGNLLEKFVFKLTLLRFWYLTSLAEIERQSEKLLSV